MFQNFNWVKKNLEDQNHKILNSNSFPQFWSKWKSHQFSKEISFPTVDASCFASTYWVKQTWKKLEQLSWEKSLTSTWNNKIFGKVDILLFNRYFSPKSWSVNLNNFLKLIPKVQILGESMSLKCFHPHTI